MTIRGKATDTLFASFQLRTLAHRTVLFAACRNSWLMHLKHPLGVPGSVLFIKHSMMSVFIMLRVYNSKITMVPFIDVSVPLSAVVARFVVLLACLVVAKTIRRFLLT